MSVKLLQPLNIKHRLSEAVHDALLDAIVTGKLPPGTLLLEEELAAQLGVSTTPVRSALQVLETESLVSRTPYRSAHVRVFSPDEVREVYEVRIALETMAVRLACERITADELTYLSRLQAEGRQHVDDESTSAYETYNERFHQAIFDAARNALLSDLMKRVHHLVRLFANVTIRVPAQRRRAYQEHEQILRALTARDADRAVALMESHLRTALEEVGRAYSSDESDRRSTATRAVSAMQPGRPLRHR